MAKKVSDSQVAGIKAHAEAKNKATIDKVNKAIDKLKRKGKPITLKQSIKRQEYQEQHFITIHNLKSVF